MNQSPHSGEPSPGVNGRAQDEGRGDARTASRVGAMFVGAGSICDAAAKLTGVDGAALAVLTAQRAVRELVYATDALAQQIDELQFTLGEGPCLDVYRRNEAVLCPRLDDIESQHRWPGFTAEVTGHGVAAIFAFPVPGADRPVGVLELYRRTSGELLDDEYQAAQNCASALRSALEASWRSVLLGGSTEQAALSAAAFAAAGPLDPFTRSQVHVAAGMIAVQLSVSTASAMDRLRAYAYVENRSITAIAADVVARRLAFRDAEDGGAES